MIAHELGHITGGHLTRRDQALQGARGIAAIGMLGAAAAAVGGVPEAERRHRHRHRRRRRTAARWPTAAPRRRAPTRRACATSRRRAAIPQAMLEVLGHFRGQEALVGAYADPYAQNHPLWSERIALIEDRVGEAAAGRPALGRGRLLARADGREARRLPRQPGADAAQVSRRRRLGGGAAGARHRLAPPPGPGARRRRHATR